VGFGQAAGRHGGIGFVISNTLGQHIQKFKKISDRVGYVDLSLPQSKSSPLPIRFVIAYGPTNPSAQANPTLRDNFYDSLSTAWKTQSKRTLVFGVGDFNSKVGSSAASCVGEYAKGTRNENGQALVEWATSQQLLLANTLFKYSMRFRTTWTGSVHDAGAGQSKKIFNMIDYILVPSFCKALVRKARSYAGTETFSDHKIVIADMEFSHLFKIFPTRPKKATAPLAVQRLADGTCAAEYREALQCELSEHSPLSDSPADKREIRLLIESGHHDSHRLRKERNTIVHQIRVIQRAEANAKLDEIAEQVEKAPTSAQMFTAAAQLRSDRRQPQVIVESQDGHVLVQDEERANRVSEHFCSQFTSATTPSIPLPAPHHLNEPVAASEVFTALQRLRNRRACGPDDIPGELLKYAAAELAPTIAEIINTAISSGSDLSTVVGQGTLIPLAKPNKPRGPVTSLRPIVLLNTIRKTMSLVVLKRITNDVARHLGPIQSGFRPGRSTADVIWTQRWLSAKTTRYSWECHVLGLDMSKAFDTISRTKLLEVMSTITGPDEVCLIHHLLHHTTISVKLGSATTSAFESTIGTPQGDGLSPVLFVCYLESALRECRNHLPPRPLEDQSMPHETGYADDISFYSTSRPWLNDALPVIADTLDSWSLNVNQDKTEWLHITSASNTWRSSKQLGSLMGEEEDIRRRKEQASQSYGRMYALWLRGSKVSEKRRVRLYNAIVIPTLLYNCETWGPTAAIMNQLNSFHRQQLRSLLGIHYPAVITNEELYHRTQSRPLSDIVTDRRLRMAGHVLRMETNTPPQLAMASYFLGDAKPVRGRPKLTLATTLSNNLSDIGMPLKKPQDLTACREQAMDRREWKNLIKK